MLHLAAIRVDRPVHEMMIFAKSLLCSFLRLGAGVGECLEGVLAGVDFVAISAKHLLKESHTKAAHCDLHCLLGHNKRVLERIFDLPQRCVENAQILTPWSAVINGVVAVPLMVIIMLMAMRPDVMGRFVLPRVLWAIGWLCTGTMAVAVVIMFVTW